MYSSLRPDGEDLLDREAPQTPLMKVNVGLNPNLHIMN